MGNLLVLQRARPSIVSSHMNLTTTSKNIYWIEVLVVACCVGVVLVFIGSRARASLVREHDAVRLASLSATRGALEHYAATKGVYPVAEKPIFVSGGCIDAEAGVVGKVERVKCTAAIIGIPDEASSAYGVQYQSSADGKGYALFARQEQSTLGRLVCATTVGIALVDTCTPVARQGLR